MGEVESLLPTVAVCVPSMSMVHADFAFSLAAFAHNPGARIALFNYKGSASSAHNRNHLVEIALEHNTEYVFFLDSDMKFKQDTLKRLLKAGKDIVGATYVKRVPPYNVLGVPMEDGPVHYKDGVVEVKGLPAGCLLIKTAVFKRLHRPWFQHPVIRVDDKPALMGEDYFFCYTAREKGFSIWMDVDLSKELGHIGEQTFYVPDDKAEVADAVAA